MNGNYDRFARKAPFPFFGGKSQAAPLVWALLGDVHHYVEPFAGSLAVLLNRPHPANRPYHSETVNDADGFIVNAWRAIQLHPDETARAASWPVTEADLTARKLACLEWRTQQNLDRLAGDAEWCDTTIAGWWIWAVSCSIELGAWQGPWVKDPETGRLVRKPRGAKGEGVSRERPYLSNSGTGCNHPSLRQQGVSREIPHLGDDGKGCNNHTLRQEGVSRRRPHLMDSGQGCNNPTLRCDCENLVMPGLLEWFRMLSARLRHVRICNGDWSRICTEAVIDTLAVRQRSDARAGIFLDPPYSHDVRDSELYATDSATIADDVRQWCLEHGANPKWRIILAGFDTEHSVLLDHGWREYPWFKDGWLRGGMAKAGGNHQQHRERLWASPACLMPQQAPADSQLELHSMRRQ